MNIPDVTNFSDEQWTSVVDKIRRLGDIYEKKRRLEGLKEACMEAEETQMSIDAGARLRNYRSLIQAELDRLPALDVQGSAGTREVTGETLDALFTGLQIDSGNCRPDEREENANVKHVEVKPGRQYRKVVRRNLDGKNTPVIVHHRNPKDMLDATSADEKNDGDEDVSVSSEDDEAARYGIKINGTKKNNDTKLATLEIPISEDVLAKAAATGAQRPARPGSASSSGGSTHAVVGKNREHWYGRVGADERQLGRGGGMEDEGRGDEEDSYGSSSDGSITSPAVIAESAFRST